MRNSSCLLLILGNHGGFFKYINYFFAGLFSSLVNCEIHKSRDERLDIDKKYDMLPSFKDIDVFGTALELNYSKAE